MQTALARGVGQRLHFAVVDETAAIKDHLVDVLRLRALGDELANGRGRGGISLRLLRLSSASVVFALAMVRPTVSSMTCA